MGILPTGKMYAVVSQSSVLQVVPRCVLKNDQVILNLVPEKWPLLLKSSLYRCGPQNTRTRDFTRAMVEQ